LKATLQLAELGAVEHHQARSKSPSSTCCSATRTTRTGVLRSQEAIQDRVPHYQRSEFPGKPRRGIGEDARDRKGDDDQQQRDCDAIRFAVKTGTLPSRCATVFSATMVESA
jgi:hypothetical protein